MGDIKSFVEAFNQFDYSTAILNSLSDEPIQQEALDTICSTVGVEVTRAQWAVARPVLFSIAIQKVKQVTQRPIVAALSAVAAAVTERQLEIAITVLGTLGFERDDLSDETTLTLININIRKVTAAAIADESYTAARARADLLAPIA